MYCSEVKGGVSNRFRKMTKYDFILRQEDGFGPLVGHMLGCVTICKSWAWLALSLRANDIIT